MKLISDWKATIGRAWSVRLAALFAAVSALIMANPSLLLGLIAFIPEGLRPLAAVGTFLITFIVPTLVRILQQKPDEPA